ncbi:long-chain-fatty-acid--protein ligase [Brevibacterium yomogidense]|uniref:hypothetical protein n=1 Tax=Brevibacterium yomogidense TaxID=946573 RepID=UPI0018E00014|nr:hypothetical protein [Brevibacterium yomogidense]
MTTASTAPPRDPAAFSLLDADILAFIEADDPDPGAFDALALRLFTHQFESNPAYRRYCLARKATPGRVRHWTGIPAVPLTAFKQLTLATFPPEDAQAVFMTSGSTDPSTRGRNHHPHLSLYDASLIRSFRDQFLPQTTGPQPTDSQSPVPQTTHAAADTGSIRLLVLNPPRAQAPHSSIAHFFSTLVEQFGTPDSRHLVHDGTLDVAAAISACADAEARNEPLAILGTSFSFVHLLDAMAAADRSFRLPPGSRVLDTGGFKGKSRDVSATELRHDLSQRLGVPAHLCRNYYGMTEISTQYYDRAPLVASPTAPTAGGISQPGDHTEDGALTPGERAKVVPHWARLVVVDPLSRQPVPHGEPGLLMHMDLANIGSCMAVLSDDLGWAIGPEPGSTALGTADVVLRGRAAGTEARGCSLALDEILSANRTSTSAEDRR